ncbi:sulfite exporter TauE/SafE family protein [bacterium AH-315-E10]|nr:sulfite exporter TauE/SafE family protein [bacterium AH-315-E10]
MTTTAILLIIIIVFTTHLIGGIAAFGSALVSLPLILLINPDLNWCVFLLVTIGCVQSFQVLYYCRRSLDRKELSRILIFMMVGAVIGVTGIVYLSQNFLMGFLSLLIFSTAGYALCKPEKRMLNIPKPMKIILLLLSGVAHGAFGCGGAGLTVYATAVFKDKEAFRATLSATWSIFNFCLIPIFYMRTAGGDRHFPLIAACIVIVVLVSFMAQKLSKRFNQERFFKFTSILLIISGLVNTYNIFQS